MSPAFQINLDDIIRRVAIRTAQDTGAQLHAQAVVALDMASREVASKGRRILDAEPDITREALIERLSAHLRSLLTP